MHEYTSFENTDNQYSPVELAHCLKNSLLTNEKTGCFIQQNFEDLDLYQDFQKATERQKEKFIHELNLFLENEEIQKNENLSHAIKNLKQEMLNQPYGGITRSLSESFTDFVYHCDASLDPIVQQCHQTHDDVQSVLL